MTHLRYGATSSEEAPRPRDMGDGNRRMLAGSIVLSFVAAGAAVVGLSSRGKVGGLGLSALLSEEVGHASLHGDRQWNDYGSYKEVRQFTLSQAKRHSMHIYLCLLRSQRFTNGERARQRQRQRQRVSAAAMVWRKIK